MSIPLCNQIDIHERGPRIVHEKRHWDSEGFERTERRVGADQCPKCGLWWPIIEQPDMWQEDAAGRWSAEGWWGGVVCEQCEILIIDQPDGHGECYYLSSISENQ